MEKVFFTPGDLVTLRQKELNPPVMLVMQKETYTFRNSDKRDTVFKGIKCRWFSTDNKLQEAVFNTKDLLKVNTND